MAKTIEQLQALAQTIKQETIAKKNDATRVGGTLEDMIDKMEADAIDTTEKLATIGQKVGKLVTPQDSQETTYVTGIADDKGNLALGINANGEVVTKGFNSANTTNTTNTEDFALAIGDKNKNVALAVDKYGNLYTKKFDSTNIGSGNAKIVADDSDNLLGVGDINGNLVAVIDKDGNFKTPHFNSELGAGRTLQYESTLGQDCEIITANSVSADQTIQSTTYPYYCKRGLTMSFYAKFSSFVSLIIGKGYNSYRGQWFEIDGANVVRCKYDSSRVVKDTLAHGLTFTLFVKVAIYHSEDAKVDFILQTENGTYQHTFTTDYEWNYQAFAKSGGAMTDIKMTLGNNTFRKPVWMFGDSYFGVDSARLQGALKSFGYFNYFVNGLAGQTPAGAYSDLQKCLNFGTPKYLVWMLGMNGDESGWTTVLNNLKVLCKQKNIILILATIPSVPSRNRENVSYKVRNSGYRYVDMYKAVGANSSGEWYEGMLSSDGVHPTSKGAKCLATQVLVDFPELMQYGNSKGDAVGDNDGNDL